MQTVTYSVKTEDNGPLVPDIKSQFHFCCQLSHLIVSELGALHNCELKILLERFHNSLTAASVYCSIW